MEMQNYFHPIHDHRMHHGEHITDKIGKIYRVSSSGEFKSLEEAVAAIIADCGGHDHDSFNRRHHTGKRSDGNWSSDSDSESEDDHDGDYHYRKERSAQLIKNLAIHSVQQDSFGRTANAQSIPRSIVLSPGVYRLPPSLDTSVPINIVSSVISPNPDVILHGDVNSGSNKTFIGVKIINSNYRIGGEEGSGGHSAGHGSLETFSMCVFGDGFRIRICDSNIRIVECRSEMLFDKTFFIQEGNGSLLIENCYFTFRRSHQVPFSCFSLRGDSSGSNASGSHASGSLASGSNTITGSKICFNTDACPSETSRRFIPFDLRTTKKFEFFNNNVIFETNNSEVILFGTSKDISRVNISVSNCIFSNSNNQIINVSLLGYLWAANTTLINIGSIFVTKCTFKNVRLLFFGQNICSHRIQCSNSLLNGSRGTRTIDTCSHCNPTIAGWNQTIMVTFCDFNMLNANSTIVSSIIDIDIAAAVASGIVPLTNWALNIINSNFFVNNLNVPINIRNINNLTLNLTGSVFINMSTQQVQLNPRNVTNNNVINNVVTAVSDIITGGNTRIASSNGPNDNLIVRPPWIILGNVSGTSTIIQGAVQGFDRPRVENSAAVRFA